MRDNNPMYKPLKRSFFERNALKVAPELLGKGVVIQSRSKKQKVGIITEVEAYCKGDPAAHSCKGITPRTEVMFGPGGFSYVYLIYGMYHCLNFVAEKDGTPGAILIRALEIPDTDFKVANGPGKLCRFLKITKQHNKVDCCDEDSKIFVTSETKYKKNKPSIIQTTRIGISKATDYPWRWYIKDNLTVSKT